MQNVPHPWLLSQPFNLGCMGARLHEAGGRPWILHSPMTLVAHPLHQIIRAQYKSCEYGMFVIPSALCMVTKPRHHSMACLPSPLCLGRECNQYHEVGKLVSFAALVTEVSLVTAIHYEP